MYNKSKQKIMCLILILCLCLFGSGITYADSRRDMDGWELGSPYNKFYNAAEMDSFKSTAKQRRNPLLDREHGTIG